MPFPKSPIKPALGKFKLVIKPPGVSVETETGPEISAAPNDHAIKFKPPAGFSVDESLEDLLKRQERVAFKTLDEIERRYLKCAPCRKKGYNPASLDQARWATIQIAGTLRARNMTEPVKLLISHDKSGDIYLELSYSAGVAQPKTFFVVFAGAESEKPSRIARHQHHMRLEDLEEITYSDKELQSSILWFLDTKG